MSATTLAPGQQRSGWWQVFKRAADGSDRERQISKTDAAVVPLAMSPDGRSMLVRSDRKETAGDVDLMDLEGRLRPFARSEADELPGAFSPDGSRIMSVSVRTTPAFSAGTPRLLVDRNASDFDLACDGRILIAEAPDAASPGRLNVVVNWFEELRGR